MHSIRTSLMVKKRWDRFLVYFGHFELCKSQWLYTNFAQTNSLENPNKTISKSKDIFSCDSVACLFSFLFLVFLHSVWIIMYIAFVDAIYAFCIRWTHFHGMHVNVFAYKIKCWTNKWILIYIWIWIRTTRCTRFIWKQFVELLLATFAHGLHTWDRYSIQYKYVHIQAKYFVKISCVYC